MAKTKNEIGKQIGRFKIVDIYWLDSEQLIIVTDDHTDENGDDYNLEVDYFDSDEMKGSLTIYNRVYDNELKEINCGDLTQEEIDGFTEIINNHKND